MANEKRLIYANEVLQRNEEAHKKAQANPAENLVSVIQYHTVKEMVNSSPTVDAVEVVRCKDCKMEYGCRVAQWLGEDGFCSYGERKDNE